MWALAFLVVVAVGGMIWLIRWERRAASTWTVVAEGEFDRFEKRQHRYSTRSGAMVHTTTHHVVTVTAVHFTDGTSVVCWGGLNADWPKGTRIRALRNGMGAYKVEKLEEP